MPQPGQPADPPAPVLHGRRAAPTGQITRYLAELKVIGAGPSRYPRGLACSRDKATNRRGRRLPAEYRAKLAAIDTTHNGTRPGEVGPCVARLENHGDILQLVVGAFGEVSSDLDRVISALAESRVRDGYKQGMARSHSFQRVHYIYNLECMANDRDPY